MGITSKIGRALTKSKKLQKLEAEYGRKAQKGESAKEFQSRMNQEELIDEMKTSSGKSTSMKKMMEGLTLKQRRAEIRELQADGATIDKKILDMAGMEKVGDEIKVKPGMKNGGTVMKKKMMAGGTMKKKMMSAGGATTRKKKMMAGGGASMKKKSYAVGGVIRARVGASVPPSRKR